MALTDRIKALVRRVGIDVVRFPSRQHSPLADFLKRYGIATIIDVGANIGQYATRARLDGFRGTIISIEPDPTAFAELARQAQREDNWRVHRCALGAGPGRAKLHIAPLSVFNSLLVPSEYGAAADQRMVAVADVDVDVTTVDILLAQEYAAKPLLLKIDTQGFESAVLDGAGLALSQAAGVQLELSFQALYEGQIPIEAMLTRMRNEGFAPYALMPGYADPVSGALSEVDGLFCRRA